MNTVKKNFWIKLICNFNQQALIPIVRSQIIIEGGFEYDVGSF